MISEYLIETVDTHTAGEPTRIITGGVFLEDLTGSVEQQRTQFARHHDSIRRLLLREPRGHTDMFGAAIVEPTEADADVGVFFMDNGGYLDMCIHGTIGVVTYLQQTGQFEGEPGDAVHVETPAGVVRAEFQASDDGRTPISIVNVPSYHLRRVTLTDDQMGTITVDLAYSGNLFAIIDVDDVRLSVGPQSLPQLIDLATRLRDRLNAQERVVHPVTGEDLAVELIEFFQRDTVDRNATIFGNGQVDRSPCGTGTCAKLATLYAHDQLSVGESYPYDSVIGTRFVGEVRSLVEEGDVSGILPVVTGSAHLIGKTTHFLDPADPIHSFDLNDPNYAVEHR